MDPMGLGGMGMQTCPTCGQPLGAAPGMMPAGLPMGPQDAALAGLGRQGAGVPAGTMGGQAGDPMANMSPEEVAMLLQMLQAGGAGQPVPSAPMMPR